MSRARAEINLAAIAENLKFIKSKTSAQVLAVVKADAYGHGLIDVAKAAEKAGADWFGTALLEEGIALRNNGITKPIISWLTPIGEDFKTAINLDIDLSLSSIELLNEIILVGKSINKVPRVHIEIDTGMNRGGFGDDWGLLLPEIVKAVKANEIKAIGIWSHFAMADEPNEVMNKTQLDVFTQKVKQLSDAGVSPEFIHIANSAAALSNRAAHKNIIRWGIGLYGLSPDVINMGDSNSLGLKPAMKLFAKLQLVKAVKAGQSVGYGGTAITKSDTKLGVVTLGYADGVPRNANNSAGIFVAGKRAPLIGRVSMDQFVVDLGADSLAKTGDEVIVFGDGSKGEYTIDEWAKACGTINYEIVTRIGVRVPRIYSRE
ncbi:alanine racemase [Candidatus Planktophila sp.]|nr:alanine racemase [Candidatus Planktophila sp.]